MRAEQYIGLCPRAVAMLEAQPRRTVHVETVESWLDDDGGVMTLRRSHDEERETYRTEVYDKIEGAYGGEFPLYRYTLDNGEVYEEFTQAEPWSSGPMYFVGLERVGDDGSKEQVPELCWTDEEIAKEV